MPFGISDNGFQKMCLGISDNAFQKMLLGEMFLILLGNGY
jgi:hypothetical protein